MNLVQTFPLNITELWNYRKTTVKCSSICKYLRLMISQVLPCIKLIKKVIFALQVCSFLLILISYKHEDWTRFDRNCRLRIQKKNEGWQPFICVICFSPIRRNLLKYFFKLSLRFNPFLKYFFWITFKHRKVYLIAVVCSCSIVCVK